MSSSHDVVKVNFKDGKVRISIDELSVKQLLKFFGNYTSLIYKYYQNLKGGSAFVTWKEENFGSNLTRFSIRRYNLKLDQSLYPKEKEYNTSTRIVSLSCDSLLIPEFEAPPQNYSWEIGKERLIYRLCLTQEGSVYIEWYVCKITELEKKHRLPKTVLVTGVKYIHIPPYADQPKELGTLLNTDPYLLYSFIFSLCSLISSEVEQRKNRLARDERMLEEIKSESCVLGITYP